MFKAPSLKAAEKRDYIEGAYARVSVMLPNNFRTPHISEVELQILDTLNDDIVSLIESNPVRAQSLRQWYGWCIGKFETSSIQNINSDTKFDEETEMHHADTYKSAIMDLAVSVVGNPKDGRNLSVGEK